MKSEEVKDEQLFTVHHSFIPENRGVYTHAPQSVGRVRRFEGLCRSIDPTLLHKRWIERRKGTPVPSLHSPQAYLYNADRFVYDLRGVFSHAPVSKWFSFKITRKSRNL